MEKRVQTIRQAAEPDVMAASLLAHVPDKCSPEILKASKEEQVKELLRVAKELGIPETATAEDLLGKNYNLSQLFAQQLALKLMSLPKPEKKFLQNFMQ